MRTGALERRDSWGRRAIVLCLVSAAACGPPAPVLEDVPAPQDLGQLDQAVQAQFQELWRDLPDRRQASEVEHARAWGRLGQWFDVYDYPESAQACYRNARRLDPEEPRWPFYLGVGSELAGDLESARSYYAESSALAPEAFEPRLRLGELALQQQDLATAEELFAEVLAEHPENAGALFGSARLALARGDAHGALAPLESLARRQPDAFEVQYSLALALRQLGDAERADLHLSRIPENALEQVPLDADGPWTKELQTLDRGARTLTRRGVRAFRRGDYTQAAVLLGRAVTADPEGPEKRINYALALRETGHWSDAVDQLEEALRLAESGSQLAAKAHLELGRLLAVRGRLDAADSHLTKALEIDPGSVVTHVELGRLHHARGRLQEALAQYQAARGLDPALADARFWHAALLLVMNRRSEALTSLEEGLRHVGDDRRLRLLMARLLSTGGPEGGPLDLRRARNLITASAEPRDLLFAESAAMVAAQEGRFDEAVAWQQAAVEGAASLRPRSVGKIARRRLELYRMGEPCQTPWEAGEIPITTSVAAP